MSTGSKRPTRDDDGPGAEEPDERPGRLLEFVGVAAVVGALTGIVAGSFRAALQWVSRQRGEFVADHPAWYWLPALVLGCAAATAVAAWLVHRVEPHAEGSGIPRVEAVVAGRTAPGRFRILPVKYLGGLLSIGAGLALGREGPSVQMGGTVAASVGRLARRNLYDLRVLVAGGAAAGLATAFNAPIAGGVFVLEELLKRFDHRTTLATLTASACGFAGAHVVLGDSGNEFALPALGRPRLAEAPAVVAVGVFCGLLAICYNAAVMRGLRWADDSRAPVAVRGAVIGGAVGVLAWFGPGLVGGGDSLTQEALLGKGTLVAVTAVFALRFVLGVVSYAALTPGGLFAPMLVLGAQSGLFVGLLADALVPGLQVQPAAMALIGMAAFFTASVQAPVTGVILATEMTGGVILLPPMLGGCAVALLIATACRAEPIYDRLTRRAVQNARRNDAEQAAAGTS